MKTFYKFLCIGFGLGILFVTPAFPQPQFTPYENNPVIAYGPEGSWDAGAIFLPEVVFNDSLYYMFYQASPDITTTPFAIGYATSSDGYTWAKFSGNPVFQSDGSGFDAWMVAEPRILVQDALWVMYYNARSAPGPGPGPAIGRATASTPDGPWTTSDNPVLQAGSAGEWDQAFVTPNCIITTDSGYVMYYSGGTKYPPPPSDHAMVGMATSPDGITWTKYDDPTTTAAPFAESDPVLPLGSPGSYDSGLAWECDVLPTQNGFEMFYTGDDDTWTMGEQICYATSTDGIHWVKDPNNPFLDHTQPWATMDIVAPSVIKIDGTYFLYYTGNTNWYDGQIGLATGTVVSSVGSAFSPVGKTFELLQNTPNPFNTDTQIRFVMQQNSHVKLEIFDLSGKRIITLLDEVQSAGLHTVIWNGSDETGGNVANGIYLYRMQAGNSMSIRKMTLLQ